MIKALKRLHADSDSLRESGMARKREEEKKITSASTKPVVSKGSIAAWSKRLLTCQPSQTDSLSRSLFPHRARRKTNGTHKHHHSQHQTNNLLTYACIWEDIKVLKIPPQLSAWILFRNSPAGEAGWLLGWDTTSLNSYAGSSSSTVQAHAHLFEAASHQLRIMIIQDREEKRCVSSIQHLPFSSLPACLSFFFYTQNSLGELAPRHLNPCSDPMCRSLPSNKLPFALIFAAPPQLQKKIKLPQALNLKLDN